MVPAGASSTARSRCGVQRGVTFGRDGFRVLLRAVVRPGDGEGQRAEHGGERLADMAGADQQDMAPAGRASALMRYRPEAPVAAPPA